MERLTQQNNDEDDIDNNDNYDNISTAFLPVNIRFSVNPCLIRSVFISFAHVILANRSLVVW